MIAATGGVLLPAGEVALAQPIWKQKSESSGSQSTARSEVYAIQPAFSQLKFGDIKPTGWILAQMRRDLQTGFAGHLDELCHEASSDIFASGRNSPGKPNRGNAASEAWWNGETEGNWRCGHIMLSCLTEDHVSMTKAKAYVDHILASQDADGYIGIFSPELRYGGNGEFWTQTCLFRGLLAYADALADQRVYEAVKRAVDRTMEGYAGGKNFHFAQHDALYTEVLEQLYAKTGDKKYLDFGLRIYHERPNLLQFHQQPLVGKNFQNCYELGHGATVAESMRMPFWLWAATGNEEYLKLGIGVISAMNGFIMPSGALVSEESVDAPPRPWGIGYEYCTIFERQFSLINAGQKMGDAAYFQAAEHLWFNAAQGSREPDGSAIVYCSFENRLSVHDELDKRQRFSPTHQHVAVCCNPNATRVAAYFVSNAWMRPEGPEPAFAATLYGPCEVMTKLAGVPLRIEERTNYPYSGNVEIILRPDKPLSFCLWLRNPEWSKETKIACSGATISLVGSFWQVRKEWKDGDSITIHFDQAVREVPALGNEFALQYGPLLYVLPVKGKVEAVKTYAQSELKDYFVTKSDHVETDLALLAATRADGFGFAPKTVTDANSDYPLDNPVNVLDGKMLRKDHTPASVTLVPMGAKSAQLRRVTFPIASNGNPIKAGL
jgi:hypothetical protein